jgi:hypothetical protein
MAHERRLLYIIRIYAVYLSVWGLIPFVTLLLGIVDSWNSGVELTGMVLSLLMLSSLGFMMVLIGIGLWRLSEIGRLFAVLLLGLHLMVAVIFVGNRWPLTLVEWFVMGVMVITAVSGLIFLNTTAVKELCKFSRYRKV